MTSAAKLIPDPVAPGIVRPCFRVYDNPATTEQGKRLRAGVYWHDLRQAKGASEPTEVDQWICTPLHVEAVTCCEGANFGRLLRFRNTLGKWREWAMPMAMLRGTGEELRGELMDMGVEIDPDGFKQLNRYIQSQHPARHVTAARATGWHDRELFIMPAGNIGTGDAILQTDTHDLVDFTQSGDLDSWREQIGRYCAGNPLLILGVCTAFAGPLLYPTRQQSGGFNLWGKSSTGKSSIEQAAASVWGHGERFLRTWNATANGLEGIATQRNDALLVLDELGESDPAKVGDIVYALANGTGRARATRSGGARMSNRWRVAVLSSGELTLSAKMAEAGKRIRAGQEVRLLDVNACRAFGCWDDLHGLADGAALSKIIKRATVTHYGHAGPEFVRQLLAGDNWDAATDGLSAMRQQYQPRNGLEGRAADRFALVALAGELAAAFGLLPLAQGEAGRAMLALYQDWQKDRSPDASEDAAIKRQLLDYLTRYGDDHFSELGRHVDKVRDRAGWWREDPAGRVWLMTGESLCRALPGFELRTVLDVLDAAGWISERDKSSGKRAKRVKVDGSNPWLYHLKPLDS